MDNSKRFKINNYNISLHKMQSSFNNDEFTIVCFSSSNNFAHSLLSKTGINRKLLNNFDTTLYDSIFFTNYGIYCLLCDLTGRYLTHILIRYSNINKINMEIKSDLIFFSIETNSSHIYSGELFGDITSEQKESLKKYNFNITDSKMLKFMGHSESAINKVINSFKSKVHSK